MLLLFASPGIPDVATRARYRDVCAARGAELIWLGRPGLSSVFNRWADASTDEDGRILPMLIQAHAPGRPGAVVLVGFSAGCWLVRRAIAHPLDAAAVAGVVYLDGLHGTGAALDGSVTYALRAMAGECICYLGHSDVATSGYPSTTQTAAEMLARVGPPAGGWRCDAHDVEPPARAKAEHGAALTGWGPSLVGQALAAVAALAPTAPTEPTSVAAPWSAGLPLESATLGERCLAWLGYQLGSGVARIPGPEHDPRILAYSEHCRRGGEFLGVDAEGQALWRGGVPLRLRTDEEAWCATTQSEALRCALRAGETPPHGLRVSVRELAEDARDVGTLRPAGYEPLPGDLALLGRLGESPLAGGRGHVRRVVQLLGDGRYLGLAGNEAGAVRAADHALADALGWVVLPFAISTSARSRSLVRDVRSFGADHGWSDGRQRQVGDDVGIEDEGAQRSPSSRSRPSRRRT